MSTPARIVAVNDIGRRIGQDHHNAKLTDADVELLLTMNEEGWGYRRLAAKFEVSKSLTRDIIKCKLRGQSVARFRKI